MRGRTESSGIGKPLRTRGERKKEQEREGKERAETTGGTTSTTGHNEVPGPDRKWQDGVR